jgi:hypothetical protein
MQIFLRILVGLFALAGAGGAGVMGSVLLIDHKKEQDTFKKDQELFRGAAKDLTFEKILVLGTLFREKGNEQKAQEWLDRYYAQERSTWFLLGAAGFGLLGLIFSSFGKGKSAGLLLLAAPVGPALLMPPDNLKVLAAFIGGLPLAGLLAFLFVRVRSRPRSVRDDD